MSYIKGKVNHNYCLTAEIEVSFPGHYAWVTDNLPFTAWMKFFLPNSMLLSNFLD